MSKAMTYEFHGALQVTSARHLQSNGDTKLDNVVDGRSDVRHIVHNALLGNDGLTSLHLTIRLGIYATRSCRTVRQQ